MLEIESLSSGYGSVEVLHELSLTANAGEILCVMGRNGAGKTTLLKTIMGLIRPTQGQITLDGKQISKMAAQEVPKAGVGYIPQGRRLFSELTVAENIQIGLMTRKKGNDTREKVLDMFPRLRERLNQRADTLSGGEQQMLATARALCIEPSVLLLDEPTEGLQPSMITLIRDAVVAMKDEGVAVILVEQRMEAVLAIADHVAFIENGRNPETVAADKLRGDMRLFKKYVGV